MTATVVRYQAKPERAEENERLIEAVFCELNEREAEGFTYKVFRLAHGVSFIHVVIEHDIANRDSLQDVPAFQASSPISPAAATSLRPRRAPPSSAATADPSLSMTAA